MTERCGTGPESLGQLLAEVSTSANGEGQARPYSLAHVRIGSARSDARDGVARGWAEIHALVGGCERMADVKVDVINFSQHPVREASLHAIQLMTGAQSVETLDAPVQIDEEGSLAGQVARAIDRLDGCDLANVNLVIVLPGLATAAACVVAELHGRVGYFPAIARLERKPGPVVLYEIVEIIDLQSVRQHARTKRTT